MTNEIATAAPQVQLILGSVRAGRICPQLGNWVMEIGRAATPLAYEMVDLRDWPLPMDDEPGIPAGGTYAQAHTIAWGRKVAAAAGFVFVTPQYNWGYPAALKNALDHLYAEWGGKPVAIISYGGHGGGKAAGQLRQVVGAMKMRPTAAMPGITLTEAMVRGGTVNPARDFAAQADDVRATLQELATMIAL